MYFLAYLKLGLYGNYIAPVDFLAILYLSKPGYKTVSWRRRSKQFLCLILLVSLLAVNIAASSYGILFRKKYIEVRGEIASLIKEYIDSRPKGIVLFFPAPYESLYNGFNIMEFVSYFNYKGFPLLIKGYEREGQCIITKAPEKLPDNLCFPRGCGLAFQCFSASQRGVI